MKIILINLARASDRREKMSAQFKSLGVDFEILEATDGRLLTAEQRNLVDNGARRKITPYPLTDNEIGCWISHRRSMQRLLDSGETMAAIIEDDAALSPEFADVLVAIEAQGARFDVIDLHRNFKRDEIFIPCRDLLPGNKIGRVGYTHMRATAYVISRHGAQEFLRQTPRFTHAIDKELHRYWANKLDIYGLLKPVAVQDDGGHSYIEETRGQDRPKERERYPDADGLYWRLMRKGTRLMDSIRKRLAFPAYVRKGQTVK